MTQDKLQRNVEGDGQCAGVTSRGARSPALPRSNARLGDATLLGELVLGELGLLAEIADSVADRPVGRS